MTTALHNLQIISDGQINRGKAVLITGNQITAIIDEHAIPADCEKIDLNGAFLAPGLIDLQVYGSGDKMFGSIPTVTALERMENDFLLQGTTGFFATVATNTNDIVEEAIEAAKTFMVQSKGNFWGLHLEGPYLNPAKKGAHPANLIKKGTVAEIEKWLTMAGGVVKMMTIAPELQDQEVIDYLHDHGIVISSGHSNATYQQGKSFLNNPIPAVTHLFNAMPQMHHRDPGYIPAIFEEKPYASIVNDGIHVDFTMVRLAKRELGDKLFLITDAVAAASEGTYHHQFKGDRYVMPDGTLSGSCLTMLKAVQNCVEHVGITLAEAINMATLYPAQLAKMGKKGKVEAGFDADFIAFDGAFWVKAVFLAGKRINLN